MSAVVTHLVRAGAPGVPERLFYASIPAGFFRAINPARGVPPFLLPQPKYFSTHVPFTAADAGAARRAMACHKTQYSADVVRRVSDAIGSASREGLPLAPAFAGAGAHDLFPEPLSLCLRGS